MSKKLIWRYIIVAVLLAWAVYSLVPTLQYERLTSAEKIELEEEGKLIDLESKIIKRGLDLQGGMHLVLEVNVPDFVRNIAQHQSRAYYDYMDKVNAKYEANPEMDYLDIMLETADEDSLRLSRYFPSEDRKTDNRSVISNLLTETEHAVIRAEEIIRNRVDEFGVSEPVIQLIGKKRIIVELAGMVDILSIHSPLTDKTRRLVGREAIQAMGPGAILVNASRGPVVDEEALIEALESGRLGGAGLDVYDTEPPAPDNPLFQMDQVALTPHLASFTDEGRQRMGLMAVEEVLRVLRGEKPLNLANPEVWERRRMIS